MSEIVQTINTRVRRSVKLDASEKKFLKKLYKQAGTYEDAANMIGGGMSWQVFQGCILRGSCRGTTYNIIKEYINNNK